MSWHIRCHQPGLRLVCVVPERHRLLTAAALAWVWD